MKAQPSYVATNGLRAYWPFNSPNTANDIGPSAYSSTLYPTSGPPVLINDRFGNSSSAYSFDGTNWIETPFCGILGDSARAVAFWAKTPGNSGVAMYSVGWGSNGTGDRFACGLDYPANQPFAGGGNCIQPYASNSPCADDKWHHYVFQFNAINGTDLSNVRVWQDAIEIFTSSVSAYVPTQTLSTTNGFNVTFGKILYPAAPANYNGSLDEVGIWNRNLTQCEISDLYYSDSGIGTMSLSSTPYTTPIINLAQYTQTLSGNNQFSTPILQSSFSGPAVSFNGGQYDFNATFSLTTGNYTITHTYTLQGGCVRTSIKTVSVRKPVGISKINNVSGWNADVYPNPTTGVIHFTTKEKIDTLFLRIKDISGKEVYSGFTDANLGLDITFLGDGMYSLEMDNLKDQVSRQKLVIIK